MRDIGELRKIASAYSENHTFIFVEEIINNEKRFYNGIILSVKEDLLIFKDFKLPNEFPILLETISVLKPSKRKEGENDG